VLDLSGNNLQILPREVFARHGLLNLQRLHLADCRIGQIDQTAFRGLTNLVELNLAGNLLTSVPIATFSGIFITFIYFYIDKYYCLNRGNLIRSTIIFLNMLFKGVSKLVHAVFCNSIFIFISTTKLVGYTTSHL
jgi:Leucine-rich repeat (LRR) protein